MFILDTMLVGSLRFVLDKIVAAAEAEANDDSPLREQLLEAQMRLELGELSEDEFAQIERDVLARIREIRGDRDAVTMTSPDVRVTGVEASVAEEIADTDVAPRNTKVTTRVRSRKPRSRRPQLT